ncbi:hypothetical protein DTO212C5_4258 [Paecilomyces variotii]|nr:hypothetical protein DTO212C5_4258 [Paecilomyces variotii]
MFSEQLPRAAFLLSLSLLCLPSVSDGLRVTNGSPCTDVCNKSTTNTTLNEIVCLDQQFNTTSVGEAFKDCIECELASTYADDESGETDVSWGLYNLRYAFSTCVFGYPGSVTNVSTPCIVSCQGLSSAIELDLTSPDSTTFDAFCGVTTFGDNTVDQCEFCYGLTDNQILMANFIESVRYGCRFRTVSGTAFAINPTRIFNESVLPSATAPITTSTASSSHTVKNLTLVIVLPIVGFLILLCLTCISCFFLIRHRRKKAKARGQSQHLHARWNDTTISTPGQRRSWNEPTPYPNMRTSPGYGPGFGFADYNGQRQDVGFSAKDGSVQYASPVSPALSVPSQLYHYGANHPMSSEATYFPPPMNHHQEQPTSL